VPYELPAEPPSERGGVIWRWVSVTLVALLVLLVGYLGYVGYVGSGEAVEPPSPSRECRTPSLAYGWMYEAVNYDSASDLALADEPDLDDCQAAPAPAGDDLVTSDGVRLAGWYVPAGSGIGAGGPTIVLAHGYGANKSALLPLAALLHQDYNLVLFDFRNHGQSQDSPTTIGLLERLDVRAVIDWLEARKQATEVGVVGVSMGGAAALNEAVTDDRVVALALDSTHGTLANAIQARLERQGYPLSLPGAWAILFGGLVRTGQDMSSADPVQVAERYGERPLLVINAGLDDSLGHGDAGEIAAAGTSGGSAVQLEQCDDAGHAASIEVCPDAYRDWMLGFFGSSLERTP
jgi:hypothetical protein